MKVYIVLGHVETHAGDVDWIKKVFDSFDKAEKHAKKLNEEHIGGDEKYIVDVWDVE